MTSVDLGCGRDKYCPAGYDECIGIDKSPVFNPEIVCNLGFEKIPLEEGSVDRVTARDLLEHIPATVCYNKDEEWITHYPRIFLLREVYRILKSGCEFESWTPGYGNRGWAQDPTHCALPWTDETWNYFTGGYRFGGADDPYIDFAFDKIFVETSNIGRIHAIVRKPKN